MEKNKYGLRNRTRIANAVRTDLYKKLKEYSEETMIPISKLLDEAIEDLLNKKSSN